MRLKTILNRCCQFKGFVIGNSSFDIQPSGWMKYSGTTDINILRWSTRLT